MTTITKTIRSVIALEFSVDPETINRGQCVRFAGEVASQVEGATELGWPAITEEMPPYTSPASKVFGGHWWIKYEGRHYDAETPEGVDNFWELPWMERAIEASDYDSYIEILRETHLGRKYI